MKVRKKRTYVKHGVWHLGNRQRGGFFNSHAPLAGILAGPVIDNIAAPLIKGVVKKIIGRGAPPPRRRRQRRNYRTKKILKNTFISTFSCNIFLIFCCEGLRNLDE